MEIGWIRLIEKLGFCYFDMEEVGYFFLVLDVYIYYGKLLCYG